MRFPPSCVREPHPSTKLRMAFPSSFPSHRVLLPLLFAAAGEQLNHFPTVLLQLLLLHSIAYEYRSCGKAAFAGGVLRMKVSRGEIELSVGRQLLSDFSHRCPIARPEPCVDHQCAASADDDTDVRKPHDGPDMVGHFNRVLAQKQRRALPGSARADQKPNDQQSSFESHSARQHSRSAIACQPPIFLRYSAAVSCPVASG